MNRREMLKALGVSAVAVGGWGLLAGPAAGAPAGDDAPQPKPGDNPMFGGGQYRLPPLPYPPEALEPHIDRETVAIHHDRHHAGYVKGLNESLARLAEARERNDFALVKALSRDVAFNGAGHVLHSIYWANMAAPGRGGGGEPAGELAKAIGADFGSLAAFRGQLTAAAVAVEGSGWAVLCLEPVAGVLRILQAEKHQDLVQWGAVPLLVIDVWEHAYYLKYQNRRAEYVKALWELVNWQDVARRLDLARRLTI